MTISLEDEHAPTLESPRVQACYNALVSLHPRAVRHLHPLPSDTTYMHNQAHAAACCSACADAAALVLQALEELKLSGNPDVVNSFLRALRPFPNLTYLQLTGTPYQMESDLECQLLCSLPALRKLVMYDGGGVSLEGRSPLLNLQHLELREVMEFQLDVALPRLHTLVVDRVSEVRLGSEHLQLPALMRLSLRSDPYVAAEIPLEQLTALQELSLRGMISGMAEVDPPHSLTSLQLTCNSDTEQLAAEQLQRLELESFVWDYDQIGGLEPGLAAAVGACINLTTLALRASGPLPAELGALLQLQVLRLNSPIEGLTIAEIKRLGQLRQLRRLVLAAGQAQGGEEAVAQGAIEVCAT